MSHVIAKGIGLIGIRIVGTASPKGTLDYKGKCRGDKKVLVLILEKMKELGYNGGRVIIAHNQNGAGGAGSVTAAAGGSRRCVAADHQRHRKGRL